MRAGGIPARGCCAALSARGARRRGGGSEDRIGTAHALQAHHAERLFWNRGWPWRVDKTVDKCTDLIPSRGGLDPGQTRGRRLVMRTRRDDGRNSSAGNATPNVIPES